MSSRFYRMCIIEIEDCSNDKIFEFLFIVVQTYIRKYVRLICILYNAYHNNHLISKRKTTRGFQFQQFETIDKTLPNFMLLLLLVRRIIFSFTDSQYFLDVLQMNVTLIHVQIQQKHSKHCFG